jgi:hypothetical protein
MAITYMSDGNYIIVNTIVLKKLVNLSIENKFNRQIDDEFFNYIDPYGNHVVNFYLDHKYKGGKKTDSHKRVCFLVKMKDSMMPETILLDMTNEDFNWIKDMFSVSNEDKKQTKL